MRVPELLTLAIDRATTSILDLTIYQDCDILNLYNDYLQIHFVIKMVLPIYVS